MGTVAQTHVCEGRVRLLPHKDCLQHHGKGKAALRLDQDPMTLTSKDCGYYHECYDAFLWPESERMEDFCLETTDPLQDLKQWISTPYQPVAGEAPPLRADDTLFITRSLRFEEKHLAECILWAVEEIKQLHVKARVQIKYLESPPYNRTFPEDPISDADPPDTLPKQEDLKGLGRDDLIRLMEDVAVEMDYLQEHIEIMRKETFQVKWHNAKNGDWGEIADLLKSGWVSEEDVQRDCNV